MLEHAMNAHQYASTISDQRAAHMICSMAHGLTSMMQLVYSVHAAITRCSHTA